MTRLLLALLPLCAARAHDPITTKLTWSKEISRLVQNRCAGCHRPGGPAPFSLLTYQDARPWAVAMREEAAQRTMPPWGAVKGFGRFRGDPSLAQEELALLIEWVNGGAPEGDPQFAPKEPVLPFVYAAPLRRAPLLLSKDTSLARPRTLAAIRPQRLARGGSLQVTAELPDGTNVPVLWVRDWKPAYRHAFVLAQPLALPRGTRLRITAPVVVY
jgi:hypothetical protein